MHITVWTRSESVAGLRENSLEPAETVPEETIDNSDHPFLVEQE